MVNLFIIVAYDVNAKRCPKVMKILRKYLFHLQESVFEGNITGSDLRCLKHKLDEVLDPKVDTIVFYELLSDKYLRKSGSGKQKKLEIVI